MKLTAEQCQEIRGKRQEIRSQLIELLCDNCKDDNEYFLNLIIAQQQISQMLSEFQDLAFCEWLIKNED